MQTQPFGKAKPRIIAALVGLIQLNFMHKQQL